MSVVDDYIAAAPEHARPHVSELCAIIRAAVPEGTTETMGYGMPTFRGRKNLIHVAAQARHAGIYPGPDAVVAFADELAGFTHSKGAIQLPYDQPVPADLVRRIVAFVVERDRA